MKDKRPSMRDDNDQSIKALGGADCPICGKAVVLAYRPFCSKHCADLDLSRWLNGGYAVPAAPDPEDDDEMLAQLAESLGLEETF
jgi:endogenous inhibitor of DNA gyrase (YacG/DUF329 family)